MRGRTSRARSPCVDIRTYTYIYIIYVHEIRKKQLVHACQTMQIRCGKIIEMTDRSSTIRSAFKGSDAVPKVADWEKKIITLMKANISVEFRRTTIQSQTKRRGRSCRKGEEPTIWALFPLMGGICCAAILRVKQRVSKQSGSH